MGPERGSTFCQFLSRYDWRKVQEVLEVGAKQRSQFPSGGAVRRVKEPKGHGFAALWSQVWDFAIFLSQESNGGHVKRTLQDISKQSGFLLSGTCSYGEGGVP